MNNFTRGEWEIAPNGKARLIAAAGTAASKIAEQHPDIDVVKLFERLPEIFNLVNKGLSFDVYRILNECRGGE